MAKINPFISPQPCSDHQPSYLYLLRVANLEQPHCNAPDGYLANNLGMDKLKHYSQRLSAR